MTCPICQKPAQFEHLQNEWRLCGVCGYAFLVDAAGVVIEWMTTYRSHPRGIWAVK